MSDRRELYDPSFSPDHNHNTQTDDTAAYDFAPVPLSPSLPSHPIAPDQQAYIPAPLIRRRPSLRNEKRSTSFLDEILPTPSTPDSGGSGGDLLRRTGAVGVIVVFILVATWLAATETGGQVLGEGSTGLRMVFGSSTGKEWSVQNTDEDMVASVPVTSNVPEILKGAEEDEAVAPDFDQYIMLRTVPANMVELSGHGRRVVFLGDVHGSYAPLRKLMSHLNYSPNTDTLIHVGDLIAKGTRNSEVLDWFETRNILGVRGNHDQPVIQWRAWMEWAGGKNWDSLMDELSEEQDWEVEKKVGRLGRSWPRGWEWKGEHWHIAKKLSKSQYNYLLSLPLQLHIPSLHSHVVHAGLLPSDPLKDPDAPTQPLVAADRQSQDPHNGNAEENAELRRTSEEISILLDIPQNAHPWNLINMRGLHEKGPQAGKVTKNGKKGTPWSQVWKREMGRCTEGVMFADGDVEEDGSKGDEDEDDEKKKKREMGGHAVEANEGDGFKGKLKRLRCSPVTVIYGHAAGRGLDIKPYSKGIDTGCVYGRQLTALVLGETSGLDGKKVRVGEHRGVLVSVPCEKGGL